jgi:hypothetical protein
MALIKKEDGWVKLENTERILESNQVYVFGWHDDLNIPGLQVTSTKKEVLGRVIMDNSEILAEWGFEEDDQTKPIYFNPLKKASHTFWVEMNNPTDQEAIVYALVNGTFGNI